MNKVIVRAPVRADLAGGTLDLWPLYLFHPGARTVNVAISFFAETEICETGDGAIEIHLTDQQYRQRYESLQQLGADPKAALLFRVLEHFRLTGVRIVTRTDAPRGSGLGGSSALAVTLVRACSELAGEPVDGEALIALVRDLETRLLGIPAGIQDYYPPVYGGLGSLHLEPGSPARHALAAPIAELANHMVLHYSGIAHFSGTNNWELYKRHLDGAKKVQQGLSRIAQISCDMERALEQSNFEAAGNALRNEWDARKAMIDGISTPEIDAAIDAALAAGAWAGKVCGAGGGGCIVFLLPPERREAVTRALSTVPGRMLDVAPVAAGMTIERDRAFTAARPRLHLRSDSGIEQLYVHGLSGSYRPFVLAEGVVTHSESRSGIRHSAVRSYLAPIRDRDGVVAWDEATEIEPETLDIRAVPEADRSVDVEMSPEALTKTAAESQEAFREFLAETVRLTLFHNPAFGIYSEPSERREDFVARCQEEAKRRLADEQERLESTFRRRIDQLRERSEREERAYEKSSETPDGVDIQEVNVAWGQALYNITSGRPAAVADPAASVREGDYMENIAQIQRVWDRELEGLRDELLSQARAIEEISVSAGEKNIDVSRFLILWR